LQDIQPLLVNIRANIINGRMALTESFDVSFKILIQTQIYYFLISLLKTNI